MHDETTIVIPADHPAFAGHFPGNPIVPGVVLLDEALFAIASAQGGLSGACRVASAKFFHPVGPGTMLVVRQQRLAGGSIQFEILSGSTKVASGSVLVQASSGIGSGARA